MICVHPPQRNNREFNSIAIKAANTLKTMTSLTPAKKKIRPTNSIKKIRKISMLNWWILNIKLTQSMHSSCHIMMPTQWCPTKSINISPLSLKRSRNKGFLLAIKPFPSAKKKISAKLEDYNSRKKISWAWWTASEHSPKPPRSPSTTTNWPKKIPSTKSTIVFSMSWPKKAKNYKQPSTHSRKDFPSC